MDEEGRRGIFILETVKWHEVWSSITWIHAAPCTHLLQDILAQVDLFSPKWITCFQQTALANKPWIMQIFSLSKFGLNLTTGSKVMAKKLTFCWLKVNFLAITFETVVWWFWNFECEKICRIDDFFAKAVCRKQVIHLGEKDPLGRESPVVDACVSIEKHISEQKSSACEGSNNCNTYQNELLQKRSKCSKQPTNYFVNGKQQWVTKF